MALWRLLLNPPKTDDCIVWTHSRVSPRQYGKVVYEKRLWLVHRLAYVFHVGPIPEGYDVCHHCDNPPCWNPRHLFAGTQTDNMQDSLTKGNHYQPCGELHPKAVLTEALVRQIRADHIPGKRGFGYGSLAKLYGMGTSTIQQIIERKIWKHIR